MKKTDSRLAAIDCGVLFLLAALSSIPYLGGLGFYSDDWDYLVLLSNAAGDGPVAMFRALMVDVDMHLRPIQALVLILEYSVFGQHALGYHIVGTVFLGLLMACLDLAIRQLQVKRWLAFALVSVFALLPHYSTDRFWISSQQAVLCLLFAALGVFSLSHSMDEAEKNPKRWVAVAIAAFVLSVLSYEVAAGLIAAFLFWRGWQIYRSRRTHAAKLRAPETGVLFIIGVLAAVGIVKMAMQTRIVYHHHFFRAMSHLGASAVNAAVQAVHFNVWTYGVHLPVVLASLYQREALSGVAYAVAVVIAGLVAWQLARMTESRPVPVWRVGIFLAVAGFAIFGLGFIFFITGVGGDFATPGMNNRVAIASALGAACVEIAIVIFVSAVLRRKWKTAFSILAGVLCGLNSLVVSGLGSFWVQASTQQHELFTQVAAFKASLPPKSTVLLDGFCRYEGPAWVYEDAGDATDAFRIALNDPEFQADLISKDTVFAESAAETTPNGGAMQYYGYGARLYVYNVRARALINLPSRDVALAYLKSMDPTQDSGCPAGEDGVGTRIF